MKKNTKKSLYGVTEGIQSGVMRLTKYGRKLREKRIRKK